MTNTLSRSTEVYKYNVKYKLAVKEALDIRTCFRPTSCAWLQARVFPKPFCDQTKNGNHRHNLEEYLKIDFINVKGGHTHTK